MSSNKQTCEKIETIIEDVELATPSSSNDDEQSQPPSPPKLVDIQIVNESTALNVMVGFLNLAQRRGSYTIDESSKIHECIKMFSKSQ